MPRDEVHRAKSLCTPWPAFHPLKGRIPKIHFPTFIGSDVSESSHSESKSESESESGLPSPSPACPSPSPSPAHVQMYYIINHKQVSHSKYSRLCL